jgi:hypothetical protein
MLRQSAGPRQPGRLRCSSMAGTRRTPSKRGWNIGNSCVSAADFSIDWEQKMPPAPLKVPATPTRNRDISLKACADRTSALLLSAQKPGSARARQCNNREGNTCSGRELYPDFAGASTRRCAF